MKLLALTTVLLTTFAAHAQSSTATIPTAPATNVSAIAAPSTAKASSFNYKFDSYNALAPGAENAKKDAWASENDFKVTKKLDESRSLRLDVGFVRENGYDYGGGVSGYGGTFSAEESYMKNTYLQYVNTKAYKIGKQDIAQNFRVYAPTSQAALTRGAFLPEVRYYLATDIAVTEKFTISPTLNPRAYLGDGSYTSARKGRTAGYIYALVDFAYAFNDTFSYTVEPGYRVGYKYNRQQTQGALVDNWITAQINKEFGITIGADAVVDTENGSKSPRFTASGFEYYMNLSLSL